MGYSVTSFSIFFSLVLIPGISDLFVGGFLIVIGL